MNQNQKNVILVGVFLVAVMGIIPPWTQTSHVGNITVEHSVGYGPIFNPPKRITLESKWHQFAHISINLSRLAVRWVTLIVSTIGLVVMFKD